MDKTEIKKLRSIEEYYQIFEEYYQHGDDQTEFHKAVIPIVEQYKRTDEEGIDIYNAIVDLSDKVEKASGFLYYRIDSLASDNIELIAKNIELQDEIKFIKSVFADIVGARETNVKIEELTKTVEELTQTVENLKKQI